MPLFPLAVRNLSRRNLILLKVLTWVACFWPAIDIGYRALHGTLGANPIEYITNSTGEGTLAMLLITLAVTPARRLTGLTWLIKFRRLLGMFAFFYGVCHLMTYVWLDKFFDFQEMLTDVLKRPFITVGVAAFTLMVPLAVTSTTGWIRRMGGKKWNYLHRLIYASAILGVIHFWWKVKADHTEPIRYGSILAVLLAYRLWAAWQKSRASGKLPPSEGPAPVGA